MLSVSTSGWHFSRPSRCLTIRLQGLGLARAPQRAFFNSPDNVAPSVLRLVAVAGQPDLWFSQAPAFMRGVVDIVVNLLLEKIQLFFFRFAIWDKCYLIPSNSPPGLILAKTHTGVVMLAGGWAGVAVRRNNLP